MTRIEIRDAAASLYDGGWRAEDKADLIAEYDLTESDAEAICEELADMAAEA